jgi:hypothetical protein
MKNGFAAGLRANRLAVRIIRAGKSMLNGTETIRRNEKGDSLVSLLDKAKMTSQY